MKTYTVHNGGQMMEFRERVRSIAKSIRLINGINFTKTMKDNWISVKDILPEEGQRCLTYPHYGVLLFGVDDVNEWGIKGSFSRYGSISPNPYPTHWMPLAKPPGK